MGFPSVPEAPSRQLPSRTFSGGGVNIYQNELDNEVCVLTSHTLGTIDSSSISVAAGVRRLSRMCGEGGGNTDIPCHSKKNCYHSYPSEELEISEHDYAEDDDTITTAESILHNANEVLSRIGSSLYARRKKLSATDDDVHDNNMEEISKVERKGEPPEKVVSVKHLPADADEIIYDRDEQFQAYNCFRAGCIQDENSKPCPLLCNQNKSKKDIVDKVSQLDRSIPTSDNDNGGRRIQKLELETKQLQLILKECQIEAQRANQTLQMYRAGNNHS